jgi:hypothetical protein
MKKVKIKTWSAMAEEFGLSPLGDIATPGEEYVVTMESLLPHSRIIDIAVREQGGFIWETSADNELEIDGWIITEDMIEYEVDVSMIASDFIEYLSKNPEQRFWQALRNWSGHSFIYVSEDPIDNENVKDTFYMEGK